MSANETYTSKFPELGFYGLPGHTRNPREILKQVQDAEELGIGNVMISERPDYKEIASICGAVAAMTDSIFIGTSATNQNTRHPVVTASMCTTLDRISLGRFALGLAKGVGLRWKAMGLDTITYAREAEFVGILRKLMKGEAVANHEGALGAFPHLSVADYVDADVPLLYVGFGPKSLVNAGKIYDGTHLHTFMSDKALSDAVAHVRQGEKQAGRPEGTVKNWSVFATACDVPEEKYLKFIIARLVTYLQIPGYGDTLVEVNGWDTDKLKEIREHPSVTSVGGLVDSVASTQQIAEIEKIVPQEWRPAAIGNAKECAEAWVRQFNAGADGIIIHASTPEEFAPVLAEYEKMRPAHLFEGRTNRPA